ncbi:MAG TPA: phytoene/squalene synthase family protein [Candidatus Avamphibacillus intestinigallinarum]|nr:phytoene/squalene synthase family protein [Candidatus Avamphibacillus intestinigallinarum]
MTNQKMLEKEAMQILKDTSRTFYIPIKLLKQPLRNTVASAYLCMRAIDEIEDHETLETDVKTHLLRKTSILLNESFDETAYKELTLPYKEELPEVTLRLADWIHFCPDGVVNKVQKATGTMAIGMANWAEKNWDVQTEEDLDDYTYYVAGLVGVMLSDIWEWYDGTVTDRELAIGYGRGLQAVNILRNEKEDLAERGVGFFPVDWSRQDMFAYAERNLAKADLYMEDIKTRNITLFCKIPLALAKRTLKALKRGEEKITRDEVKETVDEIMNE